jgi:hypothetical protein
MRVAELRFLVRAFDAVIMLQLSIERCAVLDGTPMFGGVVFLVAAMGGVGAAAGFAC